MNQAVAERAPRVEKTVCTACNGKGYVIIYRHVQQRHDVASKTTERAKRYKRYTCPACLGTKSPL